jgi:hypothetical protein
MHPLLSTLRSDTLHVSSHLSGLKLRRTFNHSGEIIQWAHDRIPSACLRVSSWIALSNERETCYLPAVHPFGLNPPWCAPPGC